MRAWLPEPLDMYRIGLIVLLCILSIIRTYYKIKAKAFRRPTYRLEGVRNIALRYSFGLPLFAAVFVNIFYPSLWGWMYLGIPGWLRIAGFCLGGFALFILAWAHHSLGKNFSMSVLIQKEHHLVTTGAYRWVRHPIYDAYLLFFVAIFLVGGNWVALLAGEAVIFTLMNGRLKIEERLLREKFGNDHVRYVEGTGKFFPRLFRPVRKERAHTAAGTQGR